MKKKIEILIESIENNNIENLHKYIKFNINTCCAYKNSQNKTLQCQSKKINKTLFCGRHKSFFSRDKKNTHYLEIIKNFIKDNKELIDILKLITSNHNNMFLNNLSNETKLQDNNSNIKIEDSEPTNNLNAVINLFTTKYNFFDLHQLFSDEEIEILNQYHNLDNQDNLVKKKLKELDLYDEINIGTVLNKSKSNSSIKSNSKSSSKNISKTNAKNITNICKVYEINEHPYKKRVSNLRRSLTSTEYYKKLQSLKIKINNYITVSDKYINVLDYLIDDSLSSFSSNKILQSFNHYKLSFLEYQLIELSKIRSQGNNYNYELFATKRLEFAKLQLKSLFKTIYIGCQNYDSIIQIQNNFRIYNLHKNIKLRGLGCYNRDLCVNQTDFYSMDDIVDIPNNEFYSYTDSNKFTYGFHIDSIWELIRKKKNRIMNPYNRDIFNENMKDQVTFLHRIKKQNIKIDKNKPSIQILVKSKCIDLLSKIDMFGYQTNLGWLYNQSPVNLRYFFRRLSHHWNFKIGNDLKLSILPNGDLVNENYSSLTRTTNNNKYKLLDKILGVLDALISSSQNLDDRNAAAIIILYAMADISSEVKQCNPWID
jgi:hypothetical protein